MNCAERLPWRDGNGYTSLKPQGTPPPNRNTVINAMSKAKVVEIVYQSLLVLQDHGCGEVTIIAQQMQSTTNTCREGRYKYKESESGDGLVISFQR